jgi:hypothetical protein
LIAVSAAALLALAGGYHAHQTLQQTRAELPRALLVPIAALLKDNQSLLNELQADPYTEKDAGILESYLTKIRRDGVPKHADMKQRLDQLADNNTAIVTLIKSYASSARTPEYTAAADKFRSYAATWRDRWNSVMELFMAGGNYPAAGLPFTREFPDAVQGEIAVAR